MYFNINRILGKNSASTNVLTPHTYIHTARRPLGEVTVFYNTPDRRQSKTLLQSTDADQKSLETGFSISICRQ